MVSEEEKYERDIARQEAVAKRARSSSLSQVQNQIPDEMSISTPTPAPNGNATSASTPTSIMQLNGNGIGNKLLMTKVNGSATRNGTGTGGVAVPVATKATIMTTIQSSQPLIPPVKLEKQNNCGGISGERKMQVNGTALMNRGGAR